MSCDHVMANMNNVTRTLAWDGSAEKWTEYEYEVLWFEQSLKPSEQDLEYLRQKVGILPIVQA